MTLYDYSDCPFAKKVRIVLVEKNLEFETIAIDLDKGEQRNGEFLSLNPFGKVPVLVDEEGAVIYDSTVINEYLNDEYPYPDLLPEDAALRARARLFEDFADNAFTLPVMALERGAEGNATERDTANAAGARELVTSALGMLERELAAREYLAEAFSLADVSFAPAALRLDRLGFKLDDAHGNVKSWIQRLAERPSVGAVVKMVA